MKPQDFMEALGGVSQEKLDALAKWQEAGTPITGKAPAQEKRIMQTAAEPVLTQRRRGNMKQNTRKKASVPRLFPWNIDWCSRCRLRGDCGIHRKRGHRAGTANAGWQQCGNIHVRANC